MIIDLTTAVFLIVVGITLVQGESSLPERVPFNPQNTHNAQPKTFSPPIPNLDCSAYKPGTHWHFIKPHTGRCCVQVFVINGTFQMCGTNGGQDQLVECPKDSFNWNSPYFSGRFQFPDEAMDLCGDNGSVDGLASTSIAWDYENLTRPEGSSAILRGTVHSSSDLKVAFLFKNDDRLPLGEMKCRFLANKDIWLVEWKLQNLTLENDGFYSILVVNKQTNALSRKTRLMVLQNHFTSQQASESSKTAAESQNTTRSLQSPTPVSTSPTSTEKPGGVGDGYIYYIPILIPVLIVVFLSMKGYYCCKTRNNNLERGNNEEERANDTKSDVEDELINSPEKGQKDTTV